jgi:hypothetical protein
MGVKKTLADTVRVFGSIGITMMGTMITAPPADGSFNGSSTTEGEEQF